MFIGETKNMKQAANPSLGPIIRCPHCGYEYIPCEIFMPGDHIGNTSTVVRDALGKILYTEYDEGYEPNQAATFCCEGCGHEFIVETTTTYKAKVQEEELDFSESESSLL